MHRQPFAIRRNGCEVLAGIARQEYTGRRRNGDGTNVIWMHCQSMGLTAEPVTCGGGPSESIVQGVMQSGPWNARTRGRIPNVDRICVPACSQQVKVGFTLQPKLLPCLTSIRTANEAKGIYQTRSGRGMAAAVKGLRGAGE